MIWVGPVARVRENCCDDCQAPLGPDDGGLCIYCALHYDDDRNN